MLSLLVIGSVAVISIVFFTLFIKNVLHNATNVDWDDIDGTEDDKYLK